MASSVERYYQKKKRRKKRAKVVFFGLLFVLMMLTLVILSVTVFFNAETITVEGNTSYTAEELLETGGLKIGQNLFRLDKFEVIGQMEELPYVKTVTIKRKLPNELMVKVIENQPVVWVPTNTGVALLNEEYRVLELLEIPVELLPQSYAEPEEVPAEPKEENKETENSEEAENSEETEDSKEPEQPLEEQPAEPEQTLEDLPVYSKLKGVPQLTQITATELAVGKPALFGEEDYTGFLKRLYEGFTQNPDLDWANVSEVQFFARYDVQVVYKERITIDFGTLDQTETKLELAAYLLNDNGTTQAAVVDVSNPERVYFRPKK